MANSLFVDTSGWASLFVKTQPHHAQADQCFVWLYNSNEILLQPTMSSLLTAQRADALVKLATLRQVPLPQLMDDLGIQSPTYA